MLYFAVALFIAGLLLGFFGFAVIASCFWDDDENVVENVAENAESMPNGCRY